MALGGGELMILLILFALFLGTIAVIALIIFKLIQGAKKRGSSTTATIDIDQNLHAALTEIAVKDGVTVPRMVNDLLNDYINKRRHWPPTQ